MCQLCELKSRPLDTAFFRKNLTEVYQGISASMSSRTADGALRQFFVKLLRDTANEIEMNTVTERSITRELREMDKSIETKRIAVEAALLKEEGSFYQTYGMVMPQSVRGTIKARIWDSLDQGDLDAATQREASRDDEGNGQPGPPASNSTQGSI